MTIIKFTEKHRSDLVALLVDYFPELEADIPEDIIRGKLLDLICTQQASGFLHIRLLYSEGRCAGFSIFQIDAPESDWCKRPGWGFVREFYILPHFRRRGFGTALAENTEEALRTLGAKGLYLTADGGIPFWTHLGWTLTEEAASNGLTILEK